MKVSGTHTFAAQNKCIYCGATEYVANSLRKRGDEHIIPETIGGIFVLPDAVCESCERNINRSETSLYRGGFNAVKRHFRFRGKKRARKKQSDRIPIFDYTRNKNGERVFIPAEDYPGIMLLHVPPPPKLINKDWKPVADFWSHWVNATALQSGKTNLPSLVSDYDIDHFALVSTNCLAHARALAKIAHSAAIALFGGDSFEPLLPEFILGKAEAECFSVFGRSELDIGIEHSVHSLRFRVRSVENSDFLIGCVRLFSCLHSPAYDLVVGRIPSDSERVFSAELTQGPPPDCDLMIGEFQSYDPRTHAPVKNLPQITARDAPLGNPKQWIRVKFDFR